VPFQRHEAIPISLAMANPLVQTSTVHIYPANSAIPPSSIEMIETHLELGVESGSLVGPLWDFVSLGLLPWCASHLGIVRYVVCMYSIRILTVLMDREEKNLESRLDLDGALSVARDS
jgi:hypothetical protein